VNRPTYSSKPTGGSPGPGLINQAPTIEWRAQFSYVSGRGCGIMEGFYNVGILEKDQNMI